jgi:hypothetical protein
MYDAGVCQICRKKNGADFSQSAITCFEIGRGGEEGGPARGWSGGRLPPGRALVSMTGTRGVRGEASPRPGEARLVRTQRVFCLFESVRNWVSCHGGTVFFDGIIIFLNRFFCADAADERVLEVRWGFSSDEVSRFSSPRRGVVVWRARTVRVGCDITRVFVRSSGIQCVIDGHGCGCFCCSTGCCWWHGRIECVIDGHE